MASTKISALPGASTLDGTEAIPLVQGGVTKKATASQFVTKDAAGNVGIGVVPSAWVGGVKAINLGQYSGVWQDASGYPGMGFNAYQGVANWTYKETGSPATRTSQTNGVFQWFTAPSGTAGNQISFTQVMTLDTSGRLLVSANTASGTAKLVVGQGNTSAVNGTAVFNTGDSVHPGLVVSNWTGALTSNGPHILFDNNTFGSWHVGPGNASNSFDICRTWGTPDVRVDASGNLIQTVNTTAATLSTNGTMTFSLVSDTSLRVSVRGSDGVTRTATLTLA